MTHSDTLDRSTRRARTNKLTDRRMQLRLTSWFVAGSAFALVLQYILTINGLAQIAMDNGTQPGVAFESVRHLSQSVLLYSMMVTLPLTTVLGVLITARLAGPVFRLTRFLQATVRGEAPPDCSLRKGDELIEFSKLLNEATRPARTPRESAAGSSEQRAA